MSGLLGTSFENELIRRQKNIRGVYRVSALNSSGPACSSFGLVLIGGGAAYVLYREWETPARKHARILALSVLVTVTQEAEILFKVKSLILVFLICR